MIQKIKDLMGVKEEIDNIVKAMNTQKESFLVMQSDLESMKKDFADFRKEMKGFLDDSKKDIIKVSSLQAEFEKEINEFKLRKTQLSKQLLDRGNEELKENFERLKHDINEYNNLKKDVVAISARINTLSTEIEKFNHIANQIKEKDFDFTKFAQQIFQADKEKLELMKKIDTLERLIAKQRRTH